MSYVIQAVLSNAQHPEYGQVTIPFPMLPGACRFNPTVAPCVALCALSWGDEHPYPCRTVGGFLRALCGYFKEADKWTVPAVPPNAPWNEVDRGVENSAG